MVSNMISKLHPNHISSLIQQVYLSLQQFYPFPINSYFSNYNIRYSGMRLKGQTIRIGKKQYVLKQQLGEGGFSMIYETNYPDIICKVQVLANTEIANAYNRQKQMLQLLVHPNVVKLYDFVELAIKEEKYGLLFMENCSNGTAFGVLQKSQGTQLSEKIIVKILVTVANVLQHMHKKGVCHRDVKMENVLINNQGEFKLCDFGSCSRSVITKIDASNRVEIQQYIEKTTTPLYRSPQQLDLYSGFEIGPKVDIFALGVLAFIMSFQKPPFQSRLSAINKQYFIPDDHSYSAEFISFLEKCFTTNPAYRPSAAEAHRQLREIQNIKRIQINLPYQKEFNQTINEISRITQANLKKNSTVAEAGFFDKLKRIYNQMTTQTEGWIAGFIEDNEEAPLLKYNRSIISKCYQKRYKIEKVYEIIWKYADQSKNKCIVILKLLILLHNFIRKGPSEGITFEKQNSPLNLCIKIYKYWKSSQKTTDQDDIKRNSFVCLLIRSYCLILISKIKLCFENSNLIEANYSIVPYLTHIKENTILKLSFINSMISLLRDCLQFHENVQRINYLHQIQKSILLSLIDEEYCLVSTLTFIISTFKMAACYSREEIDFKSLELKIGQVEQQFGNVYKRLIAVLDRSVKSNLFEQTAITLNIDVIKYIKGIKLQKKSGQFSITDYLNYKNSICGLKIPLTYQQVVKNPNFLKDLQKVETNSKNVIELNQFKIKKQAQKQQKTQKSQKKIQISKAESIKSQSISNKPSSKIISQSKSPKATTVNTAAGFAKPKQSKDKIFQNFSFGEEKKPQPKVNDTKKSNMMEFTHQNLNKDFLSIDQSQAPLEKGDHFKDFFSIVQYKFEKEKQKDKKSTEQLNIYSGASKQVFASENKNQINKIQLMNFFFDEDDDSKRQSPPQASQTTPVIGGSPKKTNLIDIGQQQASINVPKQPSPQPNSKEDLISMEDQANFKTQQSNNNLVNQKPFKTSPIKENNLIDLKDFIVEEVKKNAQQYIIDFAALIFKEKIGYGNSSEVFKGQWRGRQVAIKKIKDSMNSPKSQKQFKREIMTSVRIRHHPQLVTLIGVTQHDKYFYIINEFCNGSTLFDLLHESDDKLPWGSRINIAKQIAKGMIFLHTNDPPIIHRDLKSLNVLIVNRYDANNPDTIQIKIADFGLSRDYASTYMTGTLGTYHWMAPQIFNNQPYTLKADVYSYGIVLWQIASRVPPYTNMKNPHSLMKYITLQNGRPDMNFVDKECPIELKMLMMRCWDKFPSNRPNFNEILTCLQYLGK